MSLLDYINPLIKNFNGYQKAIPHSPSFVASHDFVPMLSDKSTAFAVDHQGSLITVNGVETSLNAIRCFDSVLDSSIQTDSTASFNKKSFNMTEKVKTE